MSRTLSQWIVPAVLALSIGASTAAAQAPVPWTSVGSAGTVDEADLLRVQLGTPVPGAVSMGPGPAFRSAVRIRYNVVAVGGVLDGSVGMAARWLDRGDGQRVFLELKEYNLGTGLTTTLLTLDSDAFPAAPAFQTGSTNGCVPPFVTLNFSENAYFVDAVLSRFFPRPGPLEPPTTTTSAFANAFALAEPDSAGPALGLIKIDRAVCIE
jgi:hypothetical protein